MFRRFEGLVEPTARGTPGEPPDGLLRFYWFFLRQVRWPFAALLTLSLLLALTDAAIPVFVGRVVKLVSEDAPGIADPGAFLAAHWRMLGGMALVLLLVRPVLTLMQTLFQYQAIAPGFTGLIRWQAHWHVVRQSLGFFQNDFAGRIASRVLETGHALRQSLVSTINIIWYMSIYATSALVLMAGSDWRLALPTLGWLACYVGLLALLIPRIRAGSIRLSDAKSRVTGRVVDSYTNILTVKLFARPQEEDAFVRRSLDDHVRLHREQLRRFSVLNIVLTALNMLLVATTTAVALLLWSRGTVGVQEVATVLPLALQITALGSRFAFEVTEIFEQFGVVQEGMRAIARPIAVTDPPGARRLEIRGGAVEFDRIRFGYGREAGVIDGLSLRIAPGEKIGLVGRSGAGKSTLVNLLLRFYDLEGGRILIDGQDIAGVTQESLRAQISVVTQDTSLLHRSIRENILYGRPDAGEAAMLEAARRAHAHDFIQELEDWHGRRGYDAHVGERGVKLSGGQRQRIAIARVILKDAPILILDEATSALDSEIEAAIQEQLEGLMEGKTVIAIAHRLSTIARMDRLVILDRGRIVEQGSHAELLAQGGHYARLWRRQSGGFLGEVEETAAE
ncbi:ABC transporter ATP-binding protein [Arenibaculum pallidiluteum]|uniref:ABC transporter ATP-binding protein n=1 Tax=Arenibaculum pallidiluteum TaxID=2812559 RepID=UPI001A96ACBE|nr:ABC transporter ATP-binding protein [Arenibaculum pallidiluteum]